MRAAIYARYSTDKQKESSIDDQVNLCRRRAEAEGFTIARVHSDDSVSGSIPVAQRAGGSRLLADGLAERYDVLVVESLGRLSRDQVEQERIVRRLEHQGIIIIGVSDSYDSRMGGRKIMRGVRGLVNELYLDDLREKTRRGMSGQVDRGYVAGGKSFGYDLVKTENGSAYQINEAQACWVRWIFERYAEGWSVQRIAHELNRLGVKSPRKGTWAVSAIYGSPNKGSGILNNELYIGRYVWNRSQWVKDPDTGARQRLERPADEWKVIDAPELRIVDEQQWVKVRERMDGPRELGGRGAGAPSRTLFGGLMKCPYCGGAVVAINRNKYGCAARKDRGKTVCSGIIFSRDQADKRLLSLLRDELLSPEAQLELIDQIHVVVAERRRLDAQAENALKARLAELDGEIQRLVDAIATVGVSDALKARLMTAESEKSKLEHAGINPLSNRSMQADITARIKRMVFNLQNALENDAQRARQIISDLLGDIHIRKKEDGIYAEMNNAAEKLLISAGGASRILVAGAGFEPTTFGL